MLSSSKCWKITFLVGKSIKKLFAIISSLSNWVLVSITLEFFTSLVSLDINLIIQSLKAIFNEVLGQLKNYLSFGMKLKSTFESIISSAAAKML